MQFNSLEDRMRYHPCKAWPSHSVLVPLPKRVPLVLQPDARVWGAPISRELSSECPSTHCEFRLTAKLTENHREITAK